MAEDFKAITTQEEFDAAIKSRLERERKTIESRYSDYESLKAQIDNLTKEKSDLEKAKAEDAKKIQDQLDAANAKTKKLELDSIRTKVAIEKKLPLELRTRLSGETEEEIKADADNLAKVFSAEQRRNLPGFSAGTPEPEDKNEAAYKELLQGFKFTED